MKPTRGWMLGWSIFVSALFVVSAVRGSRAPLGWSMFTLRPGDQRGSKVFTLDWDPSVRHGGQASARLWSGKAAATDAGGISQAFSAPPWRGKRVRLGGWLRTQQVLGAGLWIRVEREGGAGASYEPTFQNAPLRGTVAWTESAVERDVPEDATRIFIGMMQTGPGTTWIDDVKVTSVMAAGDGPANLDFEAAGPERSMDPGIVPHG